MRNHKIITVFGGSGFLGSVIVWKLLRRGYRVRVAVRYPQRFGDLMTGGDVGQVALMACDIKRDSDIARAVEGCYGVVNCVGILYPSGKQRFGSVQGEAPGRIAALAREAGVETLVHVSAIGADGESASRYARSKAEGEAAVLGAFPQAVILRPSVIFGQGDSFFNRFAAMASLLPFVPLVGGETRMQPVYVGDVAEAAIVGLENRRCEGKLYELGGLDVASFESLLDLIGDYTGRRMRYFRVPFWAARVLGAVSSILPRPPLTRDQVLLLARDNVVAEGALGLEDLGIRATSLHAVLPTYMTQYAETGQYRKYREES